MSTTPNDENLTAGVEVESAPVPRLPKGELRNKRDKEGAEITAEQVGVALRELQAAIDPAVDEIMRRSPQEKLGPPENDGDSLVHTLRNGSRLSVGDNPNAGRTRLTFGRSEDAPRRPNLDVRITGAPRQYRDETPTQRPLPLKDLNLGDDVYPALTFMDNGDVLFFQHGRHQEDNGYYSIETLSPRDAMTVIDAVRAGVAEHLQALDHPDQELEALPLSPEQTEVINPVRPEEDAAADEMPVKLRITRRGLLGAGQRMLAARRGYAAYGWDIYKDAGSGEQVTIDRITPDLFHSLPAGTELFDMHTGGTVTKGVDEIQLEPRGGFIGYGFTSRRIEGDTMTVYFGPRRTR